MLRKEALKEGRLKGRSMRRLETLKERRSEPIEEHRRRHHKIKNKKRITHCGPHMLVLREYNLELS